MNSVYNYFGEDYWTFFIGALFLSSVLGDLGNVPDLHILSRLFNILMDSPVSKKNFFYLIDGLEKSNVVSLLIEHLFNDSTNMTRLCHFLALSLTNYKSVWFRVSNYLSKSYFLRLEASIETCESHMTTVDSIFYHMNSEISCDNLQLSNELIDILKMKTSILHPAILSLLIILCGGLHHVTMMDTVIEFYQDYQPKPIQVECTVPLFSPISC